MSLRAGLLLALALLLAACGGARPRPSHGGATGGHRGGWHGGVLDDVRQPQSRRYRDGSDSVPADALDVSQLVEPVPRVEPRSLYGNKSPYSVLGQRYTVLPSARGYDERGIASFYGNKFHGYKTSSLETYDMYAFSAAHKTLPLPSYARVTNLENGKSVIVRINDRGPFHANRLIDLSYAAAVKIGVWPRGTGLVEVRAIDPAHPEATPALAPVAAGPVRSAPSVVVTRGLPASAPVQREDLPAGPAVAPAAAPPAIYLQVGAFADAINAERVAERLRAAHFAPVQVIAAQSNGRSIRRVRVGPLTDVDQADEVTAQIEDMGLPRPQVAVD